MYGFTWIFTRFLSLYVESTELSKVFAKQGLKIPIRNDGTTNYARAMFRVTDFFFFFDSSGQESRIKYGIQHVPVSFHYTHISVF